MVTSEASYPTMPCSGYCNTAEMQENDLNSNLMKMIEALKEEIKSLKEIWKNTIKR